MTDQPARHPGGAPVAADRDPAALCGAPTQGGSGPPCNAWAAHGTSRCSVHGSGTPQARDKAIVVRATEKLGLPAVDRVRDFPAMVSQHIEVISDGVTRIDEFVENARLIYNEAEVRREHASLFQERRDELGVIAKLAASVARLSQAKAMNTAADAGAEFLRSQSFSLVLAAIDEALEDFPEAREALADRLWKMLNGEGA